MNKVEYSRGTTRTTTTSVDQIIGWISGTSLRRMTPREGKAFFFSTLGCCWVWGSSLRPESSVAAGVAECGCGGEVLAEALPLREALVGEEEAREN